MELSLLFPQGPSGGIFSILPVWEVPFPVDHLLDNLALGSVISANAAFDFSLLDCFSRFFFILNYVAEGMCGMGT